MLILVEGLAMCFLMLLVCYEEMSWDDYRVSASCVDSCGNLVGVVDGY